MKRLNDAAEHLLMNIDELCNDYRAESDYFEYYRAISGAINDEFLHAYFMYSAMGTVIEIHSTTECELKVREILNEWSDLIL